MSNNTVTPDKLRELVQSFSQMSMITNNGKVTTFQAQQILLEYGKLDSESAVREIFATATKAKMLKLALHKSEENEGQKSESHLQVELSWMEFAYEIAKLYEIDELVLIAFLRNKFMECIEKDSIGLGKEKLEQFLRLVLPNGLLFLFF